jgi:hypothetical protein
VVKKCQLLPWARLHTGLPRYALDGFLDVPAAVAARSHVGLSSPRRPVVEIGAHHDTAVVELQPDGDEDFLADGQVGWIVAQDDAGVDHCKVTDTVVAVIDSITIKT